MMVLILIVLCLVMALVGVAIIIGVVLILGAGRRDSVSEARQDWINRRSDKDEGGW